MSNSPLVNYTKISPNRTSPRNHKIDTITIHCYVGQASVESMAGWLCNSAAQASANYGIGTDGRIGMFVEEKDRSWCSSNKENDNRAITIECASDKTDPYKINDKVYSSLIKLCTDICKRNGIKELKWKGDKSLIGQVDKQNMTVHRWFKNKACPGDYIYNRLGKIAAEVNDNLGSSSAVSSSNSTAHELKASDLKGLSEAEVVTKMKPLFAEEAKRTGIPTELIGSQFILETGYCQTDLAQNANNCFGMKCTLSGNNWAGSTWDGKRSYSKLTKECYDGVNLVTVKDNFRVYSCIRESIMDHSAYLLNAKNGTELRYKGIANCKDVETAIHIVKSGGYATDPDYESKLKNIIKKWDLDKIVSDGSISNTVINSTSINAATGSYPKVPFEVKVIVDDLNYRAAPSMNSDTLGHTGKGVFTITKVSGNWGKLKSGIGWIYLANETYCEIKNSVSNGTFQVKVSSSRLRIRKGPGIQYSFTGKYTGIGTFTIVEEKNGWGRLKSGVGWICITDSCVTRL